MRRAALLAVLVMPACKGQRYVVQALKRELTTNQATYDAGVVAVNDRETLDLYVASIGAAPVDIFDVSVDDPDHWKISPSWMTDSSGDSGVLDMQEIPEGTPDSPSYGLIQIVFAPDAVDQFRTTLTITSNDTEVQERDADGNGLWKVVLRGLGRNPCGIIYPNYYDFGPKPAGGFYSHDFTIENCGVVTLTVTQFDIAGSANFSVDTPTPIYVLPRDTSPVTIAYVPAAEDEPDQAQVTPVVNGADFTGTIELVGNDCDNGLGQKYDTDGDGWSSCGGDCDDTNASISPSAEERSGDGIDNDCDSQIDESANPVSNDDDGDGYSEQEGDCDDADPDVHSAAQETANHIDDDCNGKIDDNTTVYDDDGDGYSEQQGDCDDTDSLVYPGQTEVDNGYDDNCNGIVDEGSYHYDDDEDGFTELGSDTGGEVDCDDHDPWTYPGAQEDCDQRDNDCDGQVDEGEDGTDNGACAFLVERKVTTTTNKGCASAPGRDSALLAALGLLGAAIRRSRRC